MLRLFLYGDYTRQYLGGLRYGVDAGDPHEGEATTCDVMSTGSDRLQARPAARRHSCGSSFGSPRIAEVSTTSAFSVERQSTASLVVRPSASARHAGCSQCHGIGRCAGDVALLTPIERHWRQSSFRRNRVGGGPVDALLTARRVMARHQATVGVVAETQYMAELVPHDAGKIVAAHPIDIDRDHAADG